MDSFEEAYDTHVWGVYAFFAYRLGSRFEAEDLTQQTFERALKAWPRFDRERAGVRTWLMAIARNLLTDHFRRGRNGARRWREIDQVPEGELPREPGPDDDLGLSPELDGALMSLGTRDREILALRFGADLNGPEIAELTGLSVANVQQILSRSLRALRLALDEQGVAPTGRRR